MQIEIIYEDDDLWVIYKPAGLATQSSKITQPDVVSELSSVSKNAYVGLVHRLDQPVEGLLVVAKKKQVAAQLSKQLTQSILNKEYYAVVMPNSENAMEGLDAIEERHTLTDYLQKNQKANLAMVVTDTYQEKKDIPKEVKKAVLSYRILACKKRDDKKIALANISIETGRFHQIRAQMAHANLPLLGDLKYASEDVKDCAKRWQVRTVALCAYKLNFLHPVTKKQMQFEYKPKGMIFQEFTHTI